MTAKFEAAKLKKELKTSGIDYEFKRLKVNDFGEPTEESEVVATIKGLYHEQNSNIQITTGETTQIRTKKIPMVLCLYEDAALAALKVGDAVTINSETFKVTGVVNIQEWSIIADISLEVVDSGVQT
jgi:Cu/Ag efflux protein CusF